VYRFEAVFDQKMSRSQYLGVIYIGDRDVGKTHLAIELANPKYNYLATPKFIDLRIFMVEHENTYHTVSQGKNNLIR
jgi:DNA replication protein DnaC